MGAAKAVAAMHVDNARVRVTEWRFAPGAATGWHVHDFDYVITPVITPEGGAPVDVTDAAGAVTRVVMHAGQSYFRQAGVAHDVINAGPGELVFVEVELKQPAR